LKCPSAAGTASLRLGLYYAKNLVQSQKFTVEIGTEEQRGKGHGAIIDYTLTGKLSDVGFLTPRTLNILTNQNINGSHTVVINGDLDDAIAFNVTEGQMRGAIDAVREALRNIHFKEYGVQLGATVRPDPLNLFDRNNAKKKDGFIDDLKRLAPVGRVLWERLRTATPARLRELRNSLLANPATIQVSRTGGSSFVFPWDLVYDIPLEADNGLHKVCRLLDEWDGRGDIVDPGTPRCPHETEHEMNTICPFGFWGFKHAIEQPPSAKEDRDLPLVVQVGDHPLELVVGLSTNLDGGLTNEHLQALRTGMAEFSVRSFSSRATLRQALANPDLEIVYFYCHGRHEQLAGTDQTITYLEIGDGESVTPGDILAWDEAIWPDDHWRETSPLVFINGCHTTDMTPEALVNFVDTFAAVYAAGVIGTEITIDQRVASEAAEEFLNHFRDKRPVGEALRIMRTRFLSKGNLLGLAYTAYCSADLKLS